jgi:hypothetical protein
MTQSAPRIQTIGLYSFPKSGNTWLRAIVAAMVRIPRGPGLLQRYVTDTHYSGVRDHVWQYRGTDWYFYKSHVNALLDADQDGPLHTDKVVYIYRHPLDVFLSYLNFVSGNVSTQAGNAFPIQFESVETMTSDQMEDAFAIFLKHLTLFPRNAAFGGMFDHIDAFRTLQASGAPVLILRYEDLQDAFEESIAQLAEFLDIGYVDLCHVWQAADDRTKKNGKFFWKRRKENYRSFLTDTQIARFMTEHGTKMAELGYTSGTEN